MLFDGDRALETLLPYELERRSQHGEFNFPKITEREIQDKSKGDALSKGLVIVQTGWFVMQCIARGVEGLPITELELVTLAFAILNFVTYWLWWNKPLSVDCAAPVYKKPSSDRGSRDTGGGEGEGEGKHEGEGDGIGGGGDESEADRAGVVLFLKIWRGMMQPLRPFVEMGLGKGEYIAAEKRVCTYYAGELNDDEESRIYLAVAVVATIFGALHCIAWSFSFPSPAEQILWRVSSVAITCVPVLNWLAYHHLDSVEKAFSDLPDCLSRPLSFIFLILISALSPLVYVPARVLLLVLPFLSLRSLPAEAYQTIHWTTFIPHI